jgi:hypothetical protein
VTNVLVTNFSYWPKCVAHSIFLLDYEKQKDNKNNIYYINWLEELKPYHNSYWLSYKFFKLTSYFIEAPVKKYLKYNKNILSITLKKKSDKVERVVINKSDDLVDINFIKSIELDGYNLGFSILSSFADKFGVAQKSYWPRNLVNQYVETYRDIYEQVLDLIEENKILTVYIYNGRFLYERAVVNAARKKKIEIVFYESGGSHKDIDLYTHDSQDFAAIEARIDNIQLKKSDTSIVQGKNWFDLKSKSNLFISLIQRIYLIYKLKKYSEQKNIIFYLSSIDEIEYVSDQQMSRLGSQQECLKMLSEICELNDFHLIIKMHPNIVLKSRSDKNYVVNQLKSLKNVSIIPARKYANSYVLLEYSDLIITYGSTMGIEASYRNKVVINLAPSLYNNLGVCLSCDSYQELESFILNHKNNRLKFIPNYMNIIKYGIFMTQRGFSIPGWKFYSDSFTSYKELKIGVKSKFLRIIIYVLHKLCDFSYSNSRDI